MKSIRECLVIGHQDIKPSRICIYKECNQYSRWCCAECMLEKKHQHQQSDDNHIIKQQDLIKYIQQSQQEERNKINKKLQVVFLSLKKLNSMAQTIQMLISELKDQYNFIKQSNQINYNDLIKQATNAFLTLEQDQIEELINFNQDGILINFSTSTEFIQNIRSQCQDLLQLMKTNDDSQNQNKQIIQQSNINLKYQDYLEQKESNDINTFQISPNDKLIAYGGDTKLLTIISLTTKQKVKEIQLDHSVKKCKFTNDSKLIFCGDQEGFLYAFDVLQNYQEVFKYKMPKNIPAINLINNYQVISCSADYSITISDIYKRQQLLKISDAHKSFIYEIQNDPINKVIISCSGDKSIKFFSQKNGEIRIDNQNAHDDIIYQIQLTNKSQNLLSRSRRELRQWQINYWQKKLTLIRQFTEEVDIYSFASLLNESFILKIFSRYLIILDGNFKTVQQHNHQIDLLWNNCYPNQTNTTNFILVMGQKQFKVLRRVD